MSQDPGRLSGSASSHYTPNPTRSSYMSATPLSGLCGGLSPHLMFCKLFKCVMSSSLVTPEIKMIWVVPSSKRYSSFSFDLHSHCCNGTESRAAWRETQLVEVVFPLFAHDATDRSWSAKAVHVSPIWAFFLLRYRWSSLNRLFQFLSASL